MLRHLVVNAIVWPAITGSDMPTPTSYIGLEDSSKTYKVKVYFNECLILAYTSGSYVSAEKSAQKDVKAGGKGYTYTIT